MAVTLLIVVVGHIEAKRLLVRLSSRVATRSVGLVVCTWVVDGVGVILLSMVAGLSRVHHGAGWGGPCVLVAAEAAGLDHHHAQRRHEH